MEVAVQRGPGFHRYEWRIEVEGLTHEPTASGTSIGLEKRELLDGSIAAESPFGLGTILHAAISRP